MSSTPISSSTSAPQDRVIALGTRLNLAVNGRLNRPISASTGELASGRDTFTRTVSRGAQGGARVAASPRHVLNHIVGSSAPVQGVTVPSPAAAHDAAGPAAVPSSAERMASQHRPGLLPSVLEATSDHTASAAGNVAGVVGTAVGAVGGLVLPAVSRRHTAEGCVKGCASAFSRAGERLVGGILTGASLLVGEAMAGVAGALTGLLAGVGMLAGGVLSLPHAAARAFGASFRREGAEKMVEAATEARAAGQVPDTSPETLHQLKNELAHAAA